MLGRRYLIHLLTFLLCSLSPMDIATAQFFDDFSSGLLQWNLVVFDSAQFSDQDPPPVVDHSFGHPSPSLDVNGNSWCGNGAYSKETFNYSQGLVIEWDMYVASGHDWNWGKGGLSSHHPNLANGRTDGAFIDATRCDTDHLAGIHFIDDGNFNRQNPFMVMLIRAEDGSVEQFRDNDARDLQNAWHHYIIHIHRSGRVDFLIDGELIWTPVKKIDPSPSLLPVLFGDRDAHGPVRVDNVKVFEGDGFLNIYPSSGGDTGSVTVRIHGSGFEQGATVKLVRAGERDILGASVVVRDAGTNIDTTFNLIGQARGAWDLVVTNPKGDVLTLLQGFTVEEGLAPDLWIEIVGLGVYRPGRQGTYAVMYGNRGNIDSKDGLIWLTGIPGEAEVGITLSGPAHPVPDPMVPPGESEQVVFEVQGKKFINVRFFSLPANSSYVLLVTLTIPTAINFELRAYSEVLP